MMGAKQPIVSIVFRYSIEANRYAGTVSFVNLATIGTL